MDEVKVVVAHSERATLRVGDVFLKVDADQARIDVEVEAMSLAPVPTPEVPWRKPPVLAIAALPGTTLGRLGGPSTGSSAAWAAAGAAIRKLHEAPLPPLPGPAGRSIVALAAELICSSDGRSRRPRPGIFTRPGNRRPGAGVPATDGRRALRRSARAC